MSIITVNGEINKKDLGITMMHEHLFLSSMFEFMDSEEITQKNLSDQKINIKNLYLLRKNPWLLKDNLILSDENIAAEELMEFKKAGGNTIVEQSSIGIGRSPKSLLNISRITGLNIVMGCGFYLKETQNNLVLSSSKSQLMKEVVNEINYGVGKANIKPGIIGEIGVSSTIEEWDKKSLEVAAGAQKETGLAISIHIQAVPTIPGFKGDLMGIKALGILEKAGAKMDKVCICHTDAKIDIRYIKKILDFGAYVELDHFSKDLYFEDNDFLMDRDFDRIIAIKELIDCGYINKILISQDNCFKTDLINFGGQGYAHILNNIIPAMMRKDITKKEINTIIIKNPSEFLDVN